MPIHERYDLWVLTPLWPLAVIVTIILLVAVYFSGRKKDKD